MSGLLQRWEGKVAIVTGASAGIGANISSDLVQEGLQVVGLARRNDKLQELAVSLQNKKGKFHPFVADMTKESDILAAFEFAKQIGPIHILVNNAGIFNVSSLVDGEMQNWKDIMDVNVMGLCIATREAVRDMRWNGVAGHIVHINSMAGHRVLPFHMYCPSKYAVTALTETLRQELNHLETKIKVTSVSPGYVKTEFQQASGMFDVPHYAEMLKKMPGLESQDVSDAVLYVLSTEPHVQVHELMLSAF